MCLFSDEFHLLKIRSKRGLQCRGGRCNKLDANLLALRIEYLWWLFLLISCGVCVYESVSVYVCVFVCVRIRERGVNHSNSTRIS